MQATRRKLLRVEETSLIEGRGVLVVAPGVPVNSYCGPGSCEVTLRMPDGEERTARATFDIPRVTPMPSVLYFLCCLPGLTTTDVPIGTEIWIDKDMA
jgi:hypothetical protein